MTIPIETDESLLEGVFKFVHPDGREQVFTMDGSEVIEVGQGGQESE